MLKKILKMNINYNCIFSLQSSNTMTAMASRKELLKNKWRKIFLFFHSNIIVIKIRLEDLNSCKYFYLT